MNFERLDYVVWGILVVIAAFVAIVVFVDSQAGVRIMQVSPINGQLGANSSVGIVFSHPMDQASVEQYFSVSPVVTGTLRWEGSTLWFDNDSVWEKNTEYEIRIREDAVSETGRPLQKSLILPLTVRAPHVIFINATKGDRELWQLPLSGETPIQITDTGGRVFDYVVSPQGDSIVFSVTTQDGGIDLWKIDMTDQNTVVLLSCSPDRCANPTWSPDGTQIAYTRERKVDAPAQPYAPSRIWTLNVVSGETAPLFPENDQLGASPSWSPDGARIAFFDGATQDIRILTLSTGDIFALKSTTGVPGSWSPSGRQMFYNGALPDTNRQSIYLVDLILPDISTWANSDKLSAESIGMPAISPDGAWVVFTASFSSAERGNQLWLMPIGGNYGNVISADETFAHFNYEWDPFSNALVYQRLKLGVSGAAPEIVYWDMDTWESVLLVENGAFPDWLP